MKGCHLIRLGQTSGEHSDESLTRWDDKEQWAPQDTKGSLSPIGCFCNVHTELCTAVDVMGWTTITSVHLIPSLALHNDSGLQFLYEEVATTLAAFIGAFGGNFIMM